MKGTVILGMVLLPLPAVAATECRVVEFPDHYEATCTGEPAQARGSPRPAMQAQADVRQQALEILPQQPEADDEARIARSEIGKRHAETWLRTQRRR